jgi:hypothetical protein
MDPSMDDQDLLNPRLDDLLRPVFVVEPPARVQQNILSAVLMAVEPTVVVASAAPWRSEPRPIAVPIPGQTISPVAYLLLGAVLLAYAGLVSWIHGAMGGPDWFSTMVHQLLVAGGLLVGQSLSAEPLAVAGMLVQMAPWLLLLPLAWLLWDRDRASAGAS